MLAAGVEPTKLQRVVPWNQERIIEAILTRALRNESLVARLVEPRSLVEASHRFFGSWAAAVTAAGLDPKVIVLPPRRNKQAPAAMARAPRSVVLHARHQPWTKELVIAALHARLREGRPMHSSALMREDNSLFRAARRHLKSWNDAMRAAGLDPKQYRRGPSGKLIIADAGPREQIARPSQAADTLRPDRPA